MRAVQSHRQSRSLVVEPAVLRSEHTADTHRGFVRRAAARTLAVRVLDLAIAIPALVCCLPLFAVAAVSVRLTSRGPALFRSQRLTVNGEPFEMLKFRTMRRDGDRLLADHFAENPEAEDEFRTLHKLANDPRVTAVGRQLRRWSIDELPQLWNVLRGDMSVVGPRPLLPHERERMGGHADTVLSVKGGLTGLWQVSGRNLLTFDERIPLDVHYVTHRSVRGDLRLIARTIGHFARGCPGAF